MITNSSDYKSRTDIGRSFEDRVVLLLEMLNFNICYRNVHEGGQEVDIIAERLNFPSHEIFLIECKASKNRPGVSVVRDVQVRVDAARAQKELRNARGWIISLKELTGPAQQLTDRLGILHCTYTSLTRHLFDIDLYLKTFIDQYSNFSKYMTESFQSKLHTVLVANELARCDLYKYYIPLSVRDEHGRRYEDVDKLLNKWLSDQTKRGLALLGDFGTGKTSIALAFMYRLATKYLSTPGGQECYIPFFIELGKYRHAKTSDLLLRSFLRHALQLDEPGISRFKELSRIMPVVLILDGFDEMADTGNYSGMLRTFEVIEELASVVPKVLITCRRTYFRTVSLQYQLFKGITLDQSCTTFPISDIKSLMGTHHHRFSLADLELLTEPQMIKFVEIRGQKGEPTVKQLLAWQSLGELAKTPLFLELILHTIDLNSLQEDFNLAQLFEQYTSLWILRESGRHPNALPPETKRLLMEELAYNCYLQTGYYVGQSVEISSVLKDFIVKHPNFDMGLSYLDTYSHEIRTCSFLSRTERDLFKFSHKSIYEFFVAKRFLRFIHEQQPGFYLARFVPWEIDEFLSQLLEEEDISRLVGFLEDENMHRLLHIGALMTLSHLYRECVQPFTQRLEHVYNNSNHVTLCLLVAEALHIWYPSKRYLEDFIFSVLGYRFENADEYDYPIEHNLLFDAKTVINIGLGQEQCICRTIQDVIDLTANENVLRACAYILARIRMAETRILLKKIALRSKSVRTRRYCVYGLALKGDQHSLKDILKRIKGDEMAILQRDFAQGLASLPESKS